MQITEDLEVWKTRKDKEKNRVIFRGIYGLIALIFLTLSFTNHELFFIGFIGFGFASKV